MLSDGHESVRCILSVHNTADATVLPSVLLCVDILGVILPHEYADDLLAPQYARILSCGSRHERH